MKRLLVCSGVIVLTWCGCAAAGERTDTDNPIATFSIVAYDSIAEEWGVAVQSKFLAVGAVVPSARAGVGAIASQAWGNTAYGPEALRLMSQGTGAEMALLLLLLPDRYRDNRQVGIVDAVGNATTWTGGDCSPWAGGIAGDGFCVQGNILAGEGVVDSMAAAFRNSTRCLAQRLITALLAGQQAGGDSRGMQSAALLVVSRGGGYSGFDDRLIDLRVDDHPAPIKELERLFQVHEKTFQAGAYIRIGVAAFKNGNLKKAGFAFDRAMAIAEGDSANAALCNEIAWELAVNNHRLEDALRFANKAASLAPKDGNIMDTLAEVYARMGDFKKAVETEKKAFELSKSPEFEKKMKEWKKR